MGRIAPTVSASDRVIGNVRGLDAAFLAVFLNPGTHSFQVPQNVTRLIAAVCGAGGSGAGCTGSDAGSTTTGGGGGGFAMGEIVVSPGDVISNITVGAGGVPINFTNSNGNAGGSSSIGTLLSATGGSGGLFINNTTTPNLLRLGGAGGVGAVGAGVQRSLARSGGRGGQIGGTYSNGLGSCATGGGGAGSVLGDGGRGGDITVIGNSSNHQTGGGGLSGNGGDLDAEGGSSAGATGGGGAGGHAPKLIMQSNTGNGYGGGGGTLPGPARIDRHSGTSGVSYRGGPGLFYGGGDSSVLTPQLNLEPFHPLIAFLCTGLLVGSGAGTSGAGNGQATLGGGAAAYGNGTLGSGGGANAGAGNTAGLGGPGGGGGGGYLSMAGSCSGGLGGGGGGSTQLNHILRSSGAGGNGFALIAWR